jgi:hypothetical protein
VAQLTQVGVDQPGRFVRRPVHFQHCVLHGTPPGNNRFSGDDRTP